MTHTTRRRSVRTPLLAAAVALAFSAPFATPQDATATGGNKRPAVEALTDRFIVKFRDGSAEHGNKAQRQQRLDAAGHAQGLHIGQLRRLGLGADVIKTDRALTPDQAKAFIGRLRADPHVEYAEVDGRMYADSIGPNDTYYGNQWHYFEPTGGINLPGAWNIATGTGEVVAVVDTGITPHSDLTANILPGYDMISDTTVSVDGDGRDADPNDPGDYYASNACGAGVPGANSSWHGTHVAGTIAAVTNNAVGVAGIAYNAKVVPVRALGKCGGFVSDIADGILWASGATVGTAPVNANPAKVINLSLGGSGACGTTYQNAINTAMANGSLVVVSAGNSNAPAANYRPSNCVGVVTVASSGRTGARSSFSNYGAAVEITAPGGDGSNGVLSTLNAGTTTQGAEAYAYYYGTSMAAPHVTAVAALARQASGDSLTPAAISALLQATARSMPFPCMQGCGAGLLDANAAVFAATTPILIISDPLSADEGNAGFATRTFTVKLSKAVASDVTFDYTTVDGTATAGSDYVAASGSRTIPAGSTSTTFTVDVNGDTDVEKDESFTVHVDNVAGPVTVVDDLGSYTIFNDETTPLANMVPVAAADPTINHNRYFSLAVPAGASNLKFQLAGGDGDADMYVSFNAVPTESTFDCRPYLTGNNETCNMTVQAGTWNVMLDAYVPYTGLTLTGSYVIPVAIGIDDVGVSEGDSGTKLVTFTVTLSQRTAAAVTFDVATAGDTATSDDDFVSASATGVTIPAGNIGKTFSVTVNGDTNIEQDETFFVNVSNPNASNTVFDGQGVGTITNDDVPSLSIDDQGTAEGDSGTSAQTFNITLSEPAVTDVTFDIATTGGTATSDDDFASNSATGVTIAAGDTSATFSVDLNGDTAIEDDEAYTVDVSNVTGATVADASGTGTITNDDFPTLDIGDAAAVTEGDSSTKTMTFTATLSQAVNFPVTFDAATDDGTASYQDDYVAGSAYTLTIPAGQLSKTFDVTINGDTDIEADETVLVNISNASGAVIGDSQASGTITNDDVPSLSIDDQGTNEGDSGTSTQTFTVSLSAPAVTDVTFDIATTGGTATADDDFASNSATGVTIAAGDTTSTFSVDLNGDTAIEDDETYTVDVANVVGATVADASGTGTITNDDFPTLSIDDAVAVTEGDSGTKVMTFTVNLSQAVNFSVGYDIGTADGSASAGSDYDTASATGETIPAGQTSKSFSVTINGDTDIEGNETVLASISNPSNASITDADASGTITNDDVPSLSIDDQSSNEGNSGTTTHTFTVSLSAAALTDVTFDIGTTGGSATADDDFASNSATGVTITAGNTTSTFSVDVNGDTALEGNESYTVDVSNVSGATVADGSGTGTITNDDYPTISIGDAPAVIEGNSGTKQMVFTVNLSAASAFPVSYGIATANGTASSLNDYNAASGTGVTIPAGQTSKTFNVTILGDGRMERSETVLVNISNASGASITDGQATGTITNDDGTLFISDVSVTEGDSGTKTMSFLVQLTQASTAPVTYNVRTVTGNSTATAGIDYVGSQLNGEVIAAGQTSRVFAVTIKGDTGLEPNETIHAVIAATGVDISNAGAYGTILNDDGAAKLSIADAGFLEGDSGTKTLNFTVSLTAPMPTPVTFNIFTVNGMAVAGEDFDGQSLVGVTIPAGQTSYTFALTTHGDTKIEGNETLFVRISNANVVVLDGQARGVLVNDDGPVLSISDATVSEGDSGTKLMTFTVSLSKLATAKVTFNFSTAAVTATAGSDFDPVSITGLVIPYGQTSRTVSVVIRGDTAVEPDETLRGNISLANVSIMDGVGIGTITNDDAP